MGRVDFAGGRRQAAFIVTVAAVVQADQMGNAAEFLDLFTLGGEFLAMDQYMGAAVLADILQLRHRQAPVQGHEDGADAPAGELDFKGIGIIEADQGDPVIFADAQGIAQIQRCLVDTGMEFPIGETPAGGEVDKRLLTRRERGVMLDPVFGDDTHFDTPIVSLPRSNSLKTGSYSDCLI